RCGKPGPPPRSTPGTAARPEQSQPRRSYDARAVSSSCPPGSRGWSRRDPLSTAPQNWDVPHALTRRIGTQPRRSQLLAPRWPAIWRARSWRADLLSPEVADQPDWRLWSVWAVRVTPSLARLGSFRPGERDA